MTDTGNAAPYLFSFYYGQTTEARLWSRPKMLFTEVREYSYQHKLPLPTPDLSFLASGSLGAGDDPEAQGGAPLSSEHHQIPSCYSFQAFFPGETFSQAKRLPPMKAPGYANVEIGACRSLRKRGQLFLVSF